MKLFYLPFCFFFFSFNVFASQKYTIPFEFINNQIYIDFQIDKNTTYRFLFDTGANGITLDSSLKDTKKFVPKTLYNNPLYFKNNLFTKTIRFLSFKNINQSSGDLCNGIIGIDFFKNYIVAIDYTQQIINLFNLDYKVDSSYIKLNAPLVRSQHFVLGLFIVPVEIELSDSTNMKGKFAIDTGSSRNITLINPSFHKHIKQDLKKGIEMNLDTPNPYYEFNDPIYFNISKLALGDIKVSNLLVDYTKLESNESFDGMIGGAFLKNFLLIIDYTNTSVYLKKKEHATSFTKNFITDGIRLRDHRKLNGKVVVSGIVNTLFDKEQIRIGDEIIAINTIPISKVNFPKLLAEKEILGTKIHYKVKRDKSIFEIECIVKKI